jgi:hypothetical protein
VDGVDLEPLSIGANALGGIHGRAGSERVATGAHAAVFDSEIFEVRLCAKGSTCRKLRTIMDVAIPRKDGLVIVVGDKTALVIERRAPFPLHGRRQA